MSPLMAYLWPSLAAGAGIGVIVFTIIFRRQLAGRKRLGWVAGGAAIAIACSLLWSGPLGGAQRFIDRIEGNARQALNYYEMTQIDARLARRPLTRELLLSGPADDFQTAELERVLSMLPGVSQARWTRGNGAPLAAQGALAAIAGLFLGLFLAYLLELHRRHNAQWDW